MSNYMLRTDVMQQLHALNSDYVQHVISTAQAAATATPPFVGALKRLTALQLHEVCATPYTLYYLPFNNASYWRNVIQLESSPTWSPPIEVQTSSARALVASVLMLAWHQSRTDAGSARLLFGMSGGTLDVFRSASVSHLLRIVDRAAALLRPRWASHPHFWSELISAAGSDFIRLQAVRLLGAQLLAGEVNADDRGLFQPSKSPSAGKVARRDDSLDRTDAYYSPS